MDRTINVIDTAPVCSFGHSEKIVGKAIAEARVRTAFVAELCGNHRG
jgi:aryl-alcohol dehydrogenase-like predicted oxidoreductase